jgi:tRNA dimethylallyltransferase
VDRQTPLIVITGPTCSGKTRLALLLSQKHPVEVVSADSMQVYRYMDIATAKPSIQERAALPHYLIDVKNPDEPFNAGIFVRMAKEKIDDISARKKIPIIVGGTGLYIKALIYGLAPAPARSDKIRRALRSLINTKGISYLESLLKRMDPDTASLIKKNDVSRVIRALEIILETGQKPINLIIAHGFRSPVYQAKIACLMPGRDLLYSGIDRRVLRMMENGLLDETQKLLDMGYSPELQSMQTLAYKHVIRYIIGEISLDEAIRLIQRDTRHFAKRQVTWMKARPDHTFFDSIEEAHDVVSTWVENLSVRPEA